MHCAAQATDVGCGTRFSKLSRCTTLKSMARAYPDTTAEVLRSKQNPLDPYGSERQWLLTSPDSQYPERYWNTSTGSQEVLRMPLAFSPLRHPSPISTPYSRALQ